MTQPKRVYSGTITETHITPCGKEWHGLQRENNAKRRLHYRICEVCRKTKATGIIITKNNEFAGLALANSIPSIKNIAPLLKTLD